MIDLVIDRTEADVAQRTAKGHYNTTDLNRVERAVQELSKQLNAVGHNLAVVVQTDWAVRDIPTRADMERYRQNIATIRAALKTLPSTPQTPHSMRHLGAQDANDIERILQDAEWLLERIPHAWWHSGATMAGQGGLIR